MKKIPEEILSFIVGQRASVLATSIATDEVHAAAMLYSCQKDPLEIYFFTEKGTKKIEKISKEKMCHASLVIGTTEELKQTLQLSGDLIVVEDLDEIEKVKEIHYQKFPQSRAYESENTVFLKFIPNWWRHTDYKTRPPVITE